MVKQSGQLGHSFTTYHIGEHGDLRVTLARLASGSHMATALGLTACGENENEAIRNLSVEFAGVVRSLANLSTYGDEGSLSPEADEPKSDVGWAARRASSNENTEQHAKRLGHDVRTISHSGTVRCACGAAFATDVGYFEHVWTLPEPLAFERDEYAYVWTLGGAEAARMFFGSPLDAEVKLFKSAPETEREKRKYDPKAQLWGVKHPSKLSTNDNPGSTPKARR